MEELRKLQTELSVPKGQRNTFGNYDYRSCEDILEAVKPMLKKLKCTLILEDEMVLIGDRYYVKALATLRNEEGNPASNTGYAREAEIKKGMDAAQITGAASSYARKYALAGLFLLDDNKDADTMDNSEKPAKKAPAVKTVTKKEADKLENMIADYGADMKAFCAYFNISILDELPKDKYGTAIEMLNKKYGGAE